MATVLKSQDRGKLNLQKSVQALTDASFVLENGQAITYEQLLVLLSAELGGGGGGGRTTTKVEVTSDETLPATAGTDYVVFVTAAAVITLPTAVDSTCSYTIKKKTSGAVSVEFDGAETCEGETSILLNRQNESKTFESDGTNWNII